jgi:hypothetical protein
MAAALKMAGLAVPYMTFGEGGVGTTNDKYIKTMTVNMSKVELLKQMFIKNPMVSTAMAQFMRTAFRSGIVIETILGGQTSVFNTSEGLTKLYYEKEIYPAMRKAAEEWILYGFSCISIGNSKIIKGAPIPVVLPMSEYQCQICWDFQFQRTYRITLTNVTMNKQTQKFSENARFLCMYPPDDKGSPNSPVALCLFRLIYYERLWQDKIRASYLGVRPVYLFSQDTSSHLRPLKGPEDGAVSEIFGNGEVPESVVNERIEAMRDSFIKEQTKLAFKNRQELNARRLKGGDITTLSGGGIDEPINALTEMVGIADDDQIYNQFVMPPGQKADRGPDIQSMEEFRDLITLINEDFFNALGLPVENHVYKTEKGMELMLKKLNTSVVDFHRLCGMQYADMLDPILRVYMFPEVSKRITMKDTLERVAASSSDDEGLSSSEGDSSDNDDVDAFNNTQLKARVRGIMSEMLVNVSFQTIPETTFDLLLKLRDADVINIGEFRRRALDLADIKNVESEPKEEDKMYYSEFEDQRLTKRQKTEAKYRLQLSSSKAASSSSTAGMSSATKSSFAL